MHSFSELIDRSTGFTLRALTEANNKTIEELQTSAATTLVKTLQMIQLQKAIFVVGMFSIFEAQLQDGLNCDDGFREANGILKDAGAAALKERFNDFQLATNVLKHGEGRSYEALVAKSGVLPFRIKLPGETFFFEGDVSEVSTLVEVDDNFVINCANIISEVSETLKKVRPEFSI
jgi:hypothetical protein